MAAELRLIQNDEARQVFPLPQGVLTIGRDPTNHIQLDSPAVHARHARIFTVGDSSVIQDIAGSSGIFVNDDEVVHRKLCDEDIIYIGSHRFLFVNPAAPARSDATPAGPHPAASDMETPQPAVIGVPGPVTTSADQPVQSDEPPPAPAATDEAEAQPAPSANNADKPAATGSTVAPMPQDAGASGSNIYPYPAPMSPGNEEVGDEAPAAAEVDATPGSMPLALAADNDGPVPAAGDAANIEDAAVPPSDSDTPHTQEQALAAPEEVSGTAPPAAPEPMVPGSTRDIRTMDEEQGATVVPADFAEPVWDVSPADEEDYRTPADDGTASEQAQAFSETASAAIEPVADPGYRDPHPPAIAEDAAAPAEGIESTSELVDFPPFTAGIEVLSGPNAGKRLMFSRSRIVLGRNGGRSVIIERHDNEYRVRSADRGAAATLNGTLLLQEPVPLADGDRIEFAELSAQFFQRSSISEES